MKTISKFRVRQKLQVISKLGDSHVVLGQKCKGITDRFFIVRDNFERILEVNSSISVDAELQRDTKTGRVRVIEHNDIRLPLNDIKNNFALNTGVSVSC
ncbi:hypothetical protein R1T43_09960 [Alteromonas sp. CI.11.F.A3]|uniref:hypothetical protein n=1 Tax=Alteromonas sp. CI.11.F.A3 TaxID=3079555 RepID=UPI002942860A|nr:hypothetical protein [Alteromonas sp. CI.11.F.A3]WOI39328.1 hypothetical protein R1T43_09960 [Alteromonas sp. CI.11.F.A3]